MEQDENKLVEFNVWWQRFVAWSVRDENSMWIPRKHRRMESGFTMCQTGWQHLVACGKYLGDGKGMSCDCFSPVAHHKGEGVGSRTQNTSAASLAYDQPRSSFFIFPKMWFFFYLSQRALHKTEMKEDWRREDRRQLWDLTSFLD